LIQGAVWGDNRGVNPVEFLTSHEPFSRLSAEQCARLENAIEITFAAEGTRILERARPKNEHLYVIRKGVVRLEVEGREIDELAPGEPFGFPSLFAETGPYFDVIASQDALLYRIPVAEFKRLCDESEPFSHFFRAGVAERLKRATSDEIFASGIDFAMPIGRLAQRAPVFVDRDTTVGAAARTMREQRISSVLIDGAPRGILTDRDLRGRVLAEGRGPETLVAAVMSHPLRSLSADAPLIEALLFVLSERFHHLPLERDGQIVGLVTHGDLLRHQVRSPAFLLKRFERRAGLEDISEYASEIHSTVAALASSGVRAIEIGRVVAALNDGLTRSLIQRAEEALGPPPCPYAWIVFGSEGRREQLLITDQDNALAYAEASEHAKRYFGRLGKRVVQGLLDASFPPCRGGFMATQWNHPVAEWEARFASWVEKPDAHALMGVANLFDFRAIHGDLDLEPLERLIASGGRHKLFLAHLTRASISLRPPIGLFHRMRQNRDGIDLKTTGLMPIIGLARVLALEAQSRERSTLARLDAARRAGVLSEEGAETLDESFRFLFRLRLDRQLRALSSGETPTNCVRLEEIDALNARHLKEAFLYVRQVQQAVAQRFRVDIMS
jgi:CBS domain-containing protein